jgi:translation initiation factor 2B subunit (eIF-2B alpha/beta/delta family)
MNEEYLNQKLQETEAQLAVVREENAELHHQNIFLRDTLAEAQHRAMSALDALTCVANLYEPHHIALKMVTPKDLQSTRKGILDAIALAQRNIARIGYEHIQDID